MGGAYTGEVRGGVVVFDAGAPAPPEGMRVRVEPADMEEAVRDLTDALLEFAGSAEGLPPDLAASMITTSTASPGDETAVRGHLLFPRARQPDRSRAPRGARAVGE